MSSACGSIAISRLHFPVTTLGPGKRIGVWVQGCSLGCAGCISPDTWAPGLGLTTLARVTAVLEHWLPIADGLTMTGGEPLEQPAALAALLGWWRERSKGSVLLYTGYDMDKLLAFEASAPGLIDAAMVGRFEASAGRRKVARGSDNQKLVSFSALGENIEMMISGCRTAEERGDLGVAAGPRRLDLSVQDDGAAWLAGIPGAGDMGRLGRALARAGHTLQGAPGREDLPCASRSQARQVRAGSDRLLDEQGSGE